MTDVQLGIETADAYSSLENELFLKPLVARTDIC
jgi:hypothetical protein